MKDPYRLAEKYFKGLCSQEEAEAFLKWYFSGQGEEKIKQKIDSFRLSIKRKRRRKWDPKGVFEKIQAAKNESSLFVSHKTDEVARQGSAPAEGKKVGNLPRGSQKWRYIVASLPAIVILGLGIVIHQIISKNRLSGTSLSQEYVYKSNPAGQKSTIFLKDGTQIVLNSSSRIKYPARFPSHERVIALHGEAFFVVAHDAGRPFKVIANNAEVTALGTSFNVRSFAEEKEIRIGLVKGRIEVKNRSTGSEPISLNPGEGVIYYPGRQEKMVKIHVDSEKLIAWKNGMLYFEDEPIGDVLKTLERWYGVEFIIEGELKGIFTGKFKNQSLEAVLEGMSYSFSLDYDINGKYVRLTSKQDKK